MIPPACSGSALVSHASWTYLEYFHSEASSRPPIRWAIHLDWLLSKAVRFQTSSDVCADCPIHTLSFVRSWPSHCESLLRAKEFKYLGVLFPNYCNRIKNEGQVVACNAGVVVNCVGEEGVNPEGLGLHLPVYQCSNPHVWPPAFSRDRKNETLDTSKWNYTV